MLDLVWSNSQSCRGAYIIDNHRLSDHDMVIVRYDVTMLNDNSKESITEEGWDELIRNLMLESWEGVTAMEPVELQERITSNLDKVAMKTSELKRRPQGRKNLQQSSENV